ncbi:MAG: single-stranded DNA-binding protein [Anaerolineae bacterium]|nr:single-stranded DNA-binding protein [Anaerolineae bacterium]
MFHRVTLIGHVGQDPQMRYTPDGTPVTNISVATKTSVSKETNPQCPAGWKESYNGRAWELTTWWRVTCWRKLAEIVNQYVTKGMQVFVEGEVRGDAQNGTQNPRVWTGNDGIAKASFELTARTVKMLGARAEGGAEAPVGEPPPGGFEEDEIPF